ncbi:hypothetical protein FJT64_025286 [Amphibalanus amphitrite]|uniref:Uncharacterized protein n=1 Tax=Amphibalanus amphitrite TaxID=1232801 RepID=A0A6A4WFI5_AMPAM|nr:hypothetical protein FJT64_025286 [Amphibalanus amphitrite]
MWRAANTILHDLVDEGPSRPHRRLFIGIGAVLVVSAIVIACVILLTREGPVVEARAGPSVTRPLPLTNGSVITLNEVLTMRYTADSFAGEWISGKCALWRGNVGVLCLEWSGKWM